jgi:hypothetical protein
MKVIVIILVFVATSAYGEIYTWTDAHGAANYANMLDDIPVRYRARAKSLNYGADPQGGAPLPSRTDHVQPAPAGRKTVQGSDGAPAMQASPSPSGKPRRDGAQQKRRLNGKTGRRESTGQTGSGD